MAQAPRAHAATNLMHVAAGSVAFLRQSDLASYTCDDPRPRALALRGVVASGDTSPKRDHASK